MICECNGPAAGDRWMECERHGCRKTIGWVELCKQDQVASDTAGKPIGYWMAWEEGRGPGQQSETPIVLPEPPPLRIQAVSFVKAMAAFAADGCRLVGGDELDRRVSICMECDRFNLHTGRCHNCGCYGKVKASGRAWHCPLDKW